MRGTEETVVAKEAALFAPIQTTEIHYEMTCCAKATIKVYGTF